MKFLGHPNLVELYITEGMSEQPNKWITRALVSVDLYRRNSWERRGQNFGWFSFRVLVSVNIFQHRLFRFKVVDVWWIKRLKAISKKLDESFEDAGILLSVAHNQST